MCGIIGINEHNPELIKKAAATFAYRGPDYQGLYSDERVTLGHNRLSIIDLDPRSSQPMFDDAKTVGIVFNGEIYNFKTLKERLSKKYHFRTSSDTEVLIYAYKEYGKDIVNHIQGMFAFAIYDLTLGKIFLFRDHVGIKPLYYYAEKCFAFASELKGITHILKQKKIPLEIDREAINLYLVMGYIPSPRTLYKGIHKLQKSFYLEFDLKSRKIVTQSRYNPPYQKAATEEEYFKLVERKVLDHLIADVPVGVFFSGGTDSSLILSILHKHGINLETFSVYMAKKEEDRKFFTAIQQKLGVKSRVYDFTLKEFDEIYPELMARVDEPTYDNSIFPTYFISKKAAEHVTVVLSGEGGDEFFYGYPQSLALWQMGNGKSDAEKSSYAKKDYELTFLDHLCFLLPSFKAKNYLFVRLFAFFKKPLSYYLLFMSPARDLVSAQMWRAAKKEFQHRHVAPMQYDQEFYLENDILRKTDFATMYSSIEGRVPLLDQDIIMAGRHFESQFLEGGVLKAFLKKMLCRYLPPDLVYRNKSGFGMVLKNYFAQSAYLKADLIRAVAYLDGRGLLEGASTKLLKKNLDIAIEKYPNYCFALVSLYRSMINNENS